MATLRAFLRALWRLYQRLFARQADAQTREVVDLLADVPAFSTCAKSTLYEVAAVVHQRDYRREEHLYFQGDPGLGLYIVQQGRLQLMIEEPGGDVQEVRQLGPNEMCGMLSLLGEFRRLETAKTLTEVRVVGFFRPDLKKLMKRNPKAGADVAMAIARYVAQQHVELVERVAERNGRATAINDLAELAPAPVPTSTPTATR